MLHIKPVAGYSIPKYPRGVYSAYPDFISRATPRGALTAALLTFLLEACDGTGTTGPPPLPPRMVTESEARTIVDQVFADNGISLAHDVLLRVEEAPGDTLDVEVDGFNDSLQVGYEYFNDQEWNTSTPHVQAVLDSLAVESGPFVKPLDPVAVADSALLRALAQEFLDSLRANGSI